MNYTKGEWKIYKVPAAFLINTDNMENIASCSNQANAHLISAAPDMYEACKEMLEELKITKGAAGIWLVRWAKALAKAEGTDVCNTQNAKR